jgi:acetoin utilization protein AcuC
VTLARPETMVASTHLFLSEALGRYGFPDDHPLSIDRQGAFWRAACARGLDAKVAVVESTAAERSAIERFHVSTYVDRVEQASREGVGYLDEGDTPAFPGCFEVSAHLVGAALEGVERVMCGAAVRTFQPIGGLHHARRDAAAGFCVFNDLGVLIETLRGEYGLRRIAYVDIDVHHGDGVYYAFEHDPDLAVADIHEDGRFLYPGTGHAHETGLAAATGTKLNLPLAPGAGDGAFFAAWAAVERFLDRFAPEFVIAQCGADGLAGDPLADLRLTPAAHSHALRSLRRLATRHAQGRLMAFGGGGYCLENLSMAWCAVLEALLEP